jgi:hypothetical protein
MSCARNAVRARKCAGKRRVTTGDRSERIVWQYCAVKDDGKRIAFLIEGHVYSRAVSKDKKIKWPQPGGDMSG